MPREEIVDAVLGLTARKSPEVDNISSDLLGESCTRVKLQWFVSRHFVSLSNPLTAHKTVDRLIDLASELRVQRFRNVRLRVEKQIHAQFTSMRVLVLASSFPVMVVQTEVTPMGKIVASMKVNFFLSD